MSAPMCSKRTPFGAADWLKHIECPTNLFLGAGVHSQRQADGYGAGYGKKRFVGRLRTTFGEPAIKPYKGGTRGRRSESVCTALPPPFVRVQGEKETARWALKRLKDKLRWRGEKISCGFGGEASVRILLGLVESKPHKEEPSEGQQEIGCARIPGGEKQRYLLPCPVLIEQARELCFGKNPAHDRRGVVETGGNKHKRFERMPNQYEIEIADPLCGKGTGEVENL